MTDSKSLLLVDGHNDLPWQYLNQVKRKVDEWDLHERQIGLHTDIPRLRDGNVGAQFWSVFVPTEPQGPAAVQATLEQIDVVYKMIRKYPDTFGFAASANDIEREWKAGRIASLIGMEGGQSIGNSLGVLRMMYTLGARYLTLTHNGHLPWADAAVHFDGRPAEPQCGGLTKFGEAVVLEMNRLGMLVDLSHVHTKTMEAALKITRAPVIFSHSSARSVCNHPRNVPDHVLQLVKENGGIVMVTFVASFVSDDCREHEWGKRDAKARGEDTSSFPPAPTATTEQVADHVDHIVRLIGHEHVGIGGDFDGCTALPRGLTDVSMYPNLAAELKRRGYTHDQLSCIWAGNLLRVMRAAERVRDELKDESPREQLMSELDPQTPAPATTQQA